jgi:hypothetical protein
VPRIPPEPPAITRATASCLPALPQRRGQPPRRESQACRGPAGRPASSSPPSRKLCQHPKNRETPQKFLFPSLVIFPRISSNSSKFFFPFSLPFFPFLFPLFSFSPFSFSFPAFPFFLSPSFGQCLCALPRPAPDRAPPFSTPHPASRCCPPRRPSRDRTLPWPHQLHRQPHATELVPAAAITVATPPQAATHSTLMTTAAMAYSPPARAVPFPCSSRPIARRPGFQPAPSTAFASEPHHRFFSARTALSSL